MPIIRRDELPWSEIARELVGAEHGLGITLLFVDAEPGRSLALHRHPYAEVIIVQEGEADVTLGGERHVTRAGDVVSCSLTRRTRLSIPVADRSARSTST